MKNAIVIDVGGTTTDLGVIQNGFPRESGVAVTIGGVRTNFRMPDVVSIGLGGGSIVRQKEDGTVTVGPDSVGYQITEKALCFGGDICTATDIAVRLGMLIWEIRPWFLRLMRNLPKRPWMRSVLFVKILLMR